MSFIVHARDVDGLRSVALGIVVCRKVDISGLARAVFLVDFVRTPTVKA